MGTLHELRPRRETREYSLGARVSRHNESERIRVALEQERLAREQLTAAGLCWRCCQPLERKLLAMLPADCVATHEACEAEARIA